MKEFESIKTNKEYPDESFHFDKKIPIDWIKTTSLHDQEKYLMRRNSYNVTNKAQNFSAVTYHLNDFGSTKSRKLITRYFSMPELFQRNRRKKIGNVKTKSSSYVTPRTELSPYNTKYSVNIVSKHRLSKFLGPAYQTNFKIYRCQLSPDGNLECCCNCKSDILFEVMKELYNCYKKGNCENCNCILCSHVPKEPEEKKLSAAIGLDNALREVAMRGFALPEGKTDSEKKIIDKIRFGLGLPPEPTSQSMRDKYTDAANAGLMVPLQDKTNEQKESILRNLAKVGIPLPKGRTSSEKALISKLQAKMGPPLDPLSKQEKLQKAKVAGLLTPLKGKKPTQREEILRQLAMQGLPLPEGKSVSETKVIIKVRKDLGLPPEPMTPQIRNLHEKAANVGLLQPLEGKTNAQKENILQGLLDMNIPLPEGRTSSENSLISKIKARTRTNEKLPSLKGKSTAEKEKILKELAMNGVLFPEGNTPSEKNLIDKMRINLGLPPEPTNPTMKYRYQNAADSGKMLPLEGKSSKEKEKILRQFVKLGIPLPKGRTSSEKALINKIKKDTREPIISPEKLRKAKAEGLFTPFINKTPEQKEKLLIGLAMQGIPLPEGKTPSDKELINKVRTDLGLPPEPTTPSMKQKHAQAADAGILVPLQGKSKKEKEKILKALHNMGIPLPEGRTASEKAIISKIKGTSRVFFLDKKIKGKPAGLLTPLEGKDLEQREKILKELARAGFPLPEGKTPSNKALIDKIRTELGLPPEPKSVAMREKYDKAAGIGKMLPLDNKTHKDKETIIRDYVDMGIPLPQGRTPSEKALIIKYTDGQTPLDKTPKDKGVGALTTILDPKEKRLRTLAMKGIPLPEAKTLSEKKLIDKIRNDLGLPPEPKTLAIKDKHKKAAAAGLLLPLAGKTHAQKEKILRGLHEMGVPLPVGRTPSEKELIINVKGMPTTASMTSAEKMHRLEGLMSPLAGKTPAQKEKILRDIALKGYVLPRGKTPSEIKIINKVLLDLGLPPAPQSSYSRRKYLKAADAGLILPLEGKSKKNKRKILQDLFDNGIPLPQGRSPSEKSLIAKIKAKTSETLPLSERIKMAKAMGLLTPLSGKTRDQKDKILRKLAMKGIPLPESKTVSEKELLDVIRISLGLPSEPKSSAMKKLHKKAANDGILLPLEGKTPAQKEKILQGLHNMGIPLPKGRTPSEKALISKIKGSLRVSSGNICSCPLTEFKEIRKLLEGKTTKQKEKILINLAKAGMPLPIGKTPSERELIERIQQKYGVPKETLSQKIKKAREAGYLTPLEGKSPEQKEKIIRRLVKIGLPLPEPKTKSEKDLIDRVRLQTGLPPEPETLSMREKYIKAYNDGIIIPLEDKIPAEKEKILRKLQKAGIPLPRGRTVSEKSMIKRIDASALKPSIKFDEMSPTQKEKMLKQLLKNGKSLPDLKTLSNKELVTKLRKELGLPLEPKTSSMKKKYIKAIQAGVLVPLEGLTPKEKEKVLREQAKIGIPLPEGRSPSEKILITKIQNEVATDSGKVRTLSEEMIRKVKKEGIIPNLKGLTSDQKEKLLHCMAEAGLPLPEGKTLSEKELIKQLEAKFLHKAKPGDKKAEMKSAKNGKKHGQSESAIKTGGEKASQAKMGKLFKGVKSTCERACGCDKKKIRFKHSYVKIKVTSPDISTICPCPEDCFKIKNGITVDDEGIKVVIGRAVGVPEYFTHCRGTISDCYGTFTRDKMEPLSDSDHVSSEYMEEKSDTICDQSTFLKSIYENSYSRYSNDSLDHINNITSPPTLVSDESRSDIGTDFEPYSKKSLYEQYIEVTESTNTYKESDLLYYVSNNFMTPMRSFRGYYNSLLIIKSDIYASQSSSFESTSSNSLNYFDESGCLLNVASHFQPVSAIDLNCDVTKDVNNNDFNNKNNEKCVTDNLKSSNNLNESGLDQSMIENSLDSESNIHHDDVIQVLQMSLTRLHHAQASQRTMGHCTQAEKGDSVIIMNNLNSDFDISTIVEDLLTKEEFKNASSLFILVPISDDEDNRHSLDVHNSTKCIQMSENHSTWKDRSDRVCPIFSSSRFTSELHGLRVSTKGKRFFLEGVPADAVTVNNQKPKDMSTKGCQMTPEISSEKFGVSTDTTQDRPCCCSPERNASSLGKQLKVIEHPSFNVMNVQSDVCVKLVPLVNTAESPFLLVNEALGSSPEPRSKRDSICSLDEPPCAPEPPPPRCNAGVLMNMRSIRCGNNLRISEVAMSTIDTNKRSSLLKSRSKDGIKYVSLQNNKKKSVKIKDQPCPCEEFALKSKQPEICQLIPAKPDPPPIPSPPKPQTFNKPLPLNTYSKPTPIKPDIILKPTPVVIEKPKIECRTFGEQCDVDYSNVKEIGPGGLEIPHLGKTAPLCSPCEPITTGTQENKGYPPMELCFPEKSEKQTEDEKKKTMPMGFYGQPDICREVGLIEVVGPQGGISGFEKDGAFTQAGIKRVVYSTGNCTRAAVCPARCNEVVASVPVAKKKTCKCSDKSGKKKKKGKVICECPPPEPEPEPEEEFDYAKFAAQLALMKSDLTQTTSGFTINQKKRKKQKPTPEWTIEDSIRYYATLNPTFLRDLVCPVEHPEDCTCEDKNVGSGTIEKDEPEEAEGPFTGLKLRFGGKGSGSKGLSGICCFDMIQDTKRNIAS